MKSKPSKIHSKKNFDAVEMKNQIQAKLYEQT